jgi:hypothetical protein
MVVCKLLFFVAQENRREWRGKGEEELPEGS